MVNKIVIEKLLYGNEQNKKNHVLQFPCGDTSILIKDDAFFKILEEEIDKVLNIEEKENEQNDNR